MNIKDLPQGAYKPVVSTTTPKLNIKSLPQGSFKPVTPVPTEEPGLLKTIGQEILNPFERIGATVVNKVAPNVDTSKGLLGNEIKPITSPREFAGETIMGLSNFMGGGVVKEGAKVAAKSIFKRALPKIANVTKNVVIPGVKAGGVYGAGQSLERGDTLQEAIPNVAENAAYGGVGAAVLGAGLPAVAKPIVNTVRGAIRRSTPEGRMAVAIENRAKELEAINNNYVNMRKSSSFTKDERKATINRVAETDVLVDSVDENGLIRTNTPGGAIDQYKALKLDGKESVVRANLERNRETARITDIKKKLDNVVETGKLPIDEAEKAKATNQVIVDALLREYPDGNVPLVRLHDEKIKVANLAYKNPDPTVRTKAKDIARGYKELVEDYSSFDVKKINQELAPIYEDIKFLEELDGKRVKGGKLSRNFAQISGNIIGGAVGNAVGGPYGAAIGAATGGELASKVRGVALSKTLGRAVNKEIPKNPVLEKAKELSTKTGGIYSKIRGSRNVMYNTANTTNNTAMPRSVPITKPQVKSDIPSGQSLRAFMKKEPVPEPPKKVEPIGNEILRTNLLKKAIDEQTAKRVKPEYEPVVPDEKLPVIQAGGKTVSKFKKADKTLPTIQAGANRHAFGAVAGIQTDEEGNVTFDPKMAAMGAIAGNVAGRKGTKELFKKVGDKAVEVYKEAGNLTTKILKDLEGKSTVSKQYILDATNRGELKQQERDLIRSVLDGEGDTVNVSDFAKKVQTELLPLERNMVGSNYPGATPYASTRAKYENITLPKESRGSVKDYSEHVYESPIKTSAGNVHFSSTFRADSGYNGKGFPNYFGHTRIEDMADDQTRRVIEVQSDLYQKGSLEREIAPTKGGINYGVDSAKLPNGETSTFAHMQGNNFLFTNGEKYSVGEILKENPKLAEKLKPRQNEIAKLSQYSNPTAHFRMVREEIKKASDDGKTKLQFPTGETAMKIEGLGSAETWSMKDKSGITLNLTKDILDQVDKDKFIGTTVFPTSQAGDDWVVTKVLGDGKFKAVSKRNLEALADDMDSTWQEELQNVIDDPELGVTETFDVSGKLDTENPIYKFYEKDLGRYLTSKYGAKTITDDKGVNWYEVAIDKKKHGAPVEAFAVGGLAVLGASNQKANAEEGSDFDWESTTTEGKKVLGFLPGTLKFERKKITHPENIKKFEEMYSYYPDNVKEMIEAMAKQESGSGRNRINKGDQKDGSDSLGLLHMGQKALDEFNKRKEYFGYTGPDLRIEDLKEENADIIQKFVQASRIMRDMRVNNRPLERAATFIQNQGEKNYGINALKKFREKQ